MSADDRKGGDKRPQTRADLDSSLIAAINRAQGTTYVATGRATTGTLGGGLFIDLGNGRKGVVTRFLGSKSHADLTAAIANQLRQQGLPIAEHRHVIELDDTIYFVQERLPGLPPPRIPSVDVLQPIVGANDEIHDSLACRAGVPLLPMCLVPDVDPVLTSVNSWWSSGNPSTGLVWESPLREDRPVRHGHQVAHVLCADHWSAPHSVVARALELETIK